MRELSHPPLFTNHDYHNIGVRPSSDDLGRFIATGDPADRGKFKTTSLRNASLRAPYFHNGRTNTLHDVVLFYERGGDFFDNIDPLMTPFSLTTQERDDLVDFLAQGLLDSRAALGMAPFDRPTLHSELAPNPETVGVGAPGAGGYVPKMISVTPPMIGSYHFAVGIAHALGGAPALLALSGAPAPPGTVAGSLPIYVDPSPMPLLIPTTLQGPPGVPGRGYGTIRTSLPDDPLLAGIDLWAQWLVFDSSVAGGLTVSDATHFTFFAP